MTENETRPLQPSAQPADIAAGIAKGAQENLAGRDVVSVGPMFADEMAGELYAQVYIALPNRAGDDFVAHLITLAHVQDVISSAKIDPTLTTSSPAKFSCASFAMPAAISPGCSEGPSVCCSVSVIWLPFCSPRSTSTTDRIRHLPGVRLGR